MGRGKSIAAWPVMPAKCATCPFGPNGDPELRANVEARLLKASQTCHHPRVSGKRETHPCRGARDFQLQLLHRLGFLPEPTDAAWQAMIEEVSNG